jgi:hypothetical protein
MNHKIDWDKMADWAESDAPFAGPPSGRTLSGEAAREAGRRILEQYGSGRPSLGHEHAQGKGSSPRRQVRLPQEVNDELDAYAAEHGQTASQVMRDALKEFFERRAA